MEQSERNLISRDDRPGAVHPTGVRRGGALAYAVVSMIALVAIASLAVDYGRYQVARAELKDAVDAAARYAVHGLADGTHASRAIETAGANRVDGSPLVLTTGDIEHGTWHAGTRQFTPGGANPNAVRVTGTRTHARGNAISTLFASILGRSSVDLSSRSIAVSNASGDQMDIFALETVQLGGGARIRATSGNSVRVGSNGYWYGPPGTNINGDVYYSGSAPTVQTSGAMHSMPRPLAFANAVVPGNATGHGDVSLTHTTKTLTAGTHHIENLSLSGSSRLVADTSAGDVRLYVSKALSISGAARMRANGSGKFEIFVTSPDGVSVSGSADGEGALYANQSDVTLSGSANWRGGVLANKLTLSGSARIQFDPNYRVPIVNGNGTPGTTTAAAIVH